MKTFWSGRSHAAKLDLYMRITLYVLPVLFALGIIGSLAGTVDDERAVPLAQGLGALVLAQTAATTVCLRHGLTHYLKGAPVPRQWVTLVLVLCAASLGLLFALLRMDGVGGSDFGMMLPYVLGYASWATYLFGSVRRLLACTALAGLLVAGAGWLAKGGEYAAGGAASVLFVAGFTLLTVRTTGWFLTVIWELDRSRDIEARLAVAEERLRFGRDMHDVLGRNLAVIALKSELAVQLAQRGRPEAADQMAEVQRIAQDSQREVREVVRGYRDADLAGELAGAQGVLKAAGIDSRVSRDGVEGDPDGGKGFALPEPVQSALGWVVREAATNVLRHGNAKWCAIRLTAADGRAVLAVENDGAPDAPTAPPGSGLAGLRERLAALDGSLEAARTEDGRWLLTASVPLVLEKQ
ncbi:sensor histidine kinase [Streptomyces sp. NPDC050504]|uniref:sensor histidine kinase n=1 Tax=Streptomyces sp. NPDC050504 TaxID=3365618 RepID=UPI0037B79CEF